MDINNLTPSQRQQLESIINSSVMTGTVNSGNSGAYQAGTSVQNAGRPMGTSLTNNLVQTYDVDEYGTPILSQAKNTGSALVTAPNQPKGSVITGKSTARLTGDPWKAVTGQDDWTSEYVAKFRPASMKPSSELTASQKMASRYGGRLESDNPTRMEDQILLSEWRARNAPQFASKPRGVSIDSMPDMELSYISPGKKTKVKETFDPWSGMRGPTDRAPKASAKGGFSFGGGGGLFGMLFSALAGDRPAPIGAAGRSSNVSSSPAMDFAYSSTPTGDGQGNNGISGGGHWGGARSLTE